MFSKSELLDLLYYSRCEVDDLDKLNNLLSNYIDSLEDIKNIDNIDNIDNEEIYFTPIDSDCNLREDIVKEVNREDVLAAASNKTGHFISVERVRNE